MEKIKKNLDEMLFWHKAIVQDIASLKKKLQETILLVGDLECHKKADMELPNKADLKEYPQAERDNCFTDMEAPKIKKDLL